MSRSTVQRSAGRPTPASPGPVGAGRYGRRVGEDTGEPNEARPLEDHELPSDHHDPFDWLSRGERELAWWLWILFLLVVASALLYAMFTGNS